MIILLRAPKIKANFVHELYFVYDYFESNIKIYLYLIFSLSNSKLKLILRLAILLFLLLGGFMFET